MRFWKWKGDPKDNAAILVRNRSTGHTVQRIVKAETVSSPEFQTWLANQNVRGFDVFIGMNPIKEGAYTRTKDNIKDTQSNSKFIRSPSAKLCR